MILGSILNDTQVVYFQVNSKHSGQKHAYTGRTPRYRMVKVHPLPSAPASRDNVRPSNVDFHRQLQTLSAVTRLQGD